MYVVVATPLTKHTSVVKWVLNCGFVNVLWAQSIDALQSVPEGY